MGHNQALQNGNGGKRGQVSCEDSIAIAIAIDGAFHPGSPAWDNQSHLSSACRRIGASECAGDTLPPEGLARSMVEVHPPTSSIRFKWSDHTAYGGFHKNGGTQKSQNRLFIVKIPLKWFKMDDLEVSLPIGNLWKPLWVMILSENCWAWWGQVMAIRPQTKHDPNHPTIINHPQRLTSQKGGGYSYPPVIKNRRTPETPEFNGAIVGKIIDFLSIFQHGSSQKSAPGGVQICSSWTWHQGAADPDMAKKAI